MTTVKKKRVRVISGYHVTCVDCDKTWCFTSMRDSWLIQTVHNNGGCVTISSVGRMHCDKWESHP